MTKLANRADKLHSEVLEKLSSLDGLTRAVTAKAKRKVHRQRPAARGMARVRRLFSQAVDSPVTPMALAAVAGVAATVVVAVRSRHA